VKCGDVMQLDSTGHYRLVGRETHAYVYKGDKVTVLDLLFGEDDDPQWAGEVIDVLVKTEKYGREIWVDPDDLTACVSDDNKEEAWV
jgi:hypothetical protein